MANHQDFSPEELEREQQYEYPPPAGNDQAAWYASRALPAAGAATTITITITSSNNNNNNNNDDLAVAGAGPATAVPLELIDPRLRAPVAAAAPAAAAAAPPAAPAAPPAPAPPPAPLPAPPGPAAAAAQNGAAQAGPRQRWTDAEVATLRTRRERGEDFVTIGRVLGRTDKACEAKAKNLAIYKNGRKP